MALPSIFQVLVASNNPRSLGVSDAFVHHDCFDSYGDPRGFPIAAGILGALIEGRAFSEEGGIAIKEAVPDQHAFRKRQGEGVPAECYSDTIDGVPALPVGGPGKGAILLNACSAGRSKNEMLAMCLAVCNLGLGCNGVQYHKFVESKHECFMWAVPNDVCFEYPYLTGCSTKANINDDIAYLCPAVPKKMDKYQQKLPLPTVELAPIIYTTEFALELDFSGTGLPATSCSDAKDALAAAVTAALPFGISSVEVECPSKGTRIPGAVRSVVYLQFGKSMADELVHVEIDGAYCGDPARLFGIPDCTDPALSNSSAHKIAKRLTQTDLALNGIAPHVVFATESTWTGDGYRNGVVQDVPRCVTDGKTTGIPITSEAYAVFFGSNVQFNPEQHAITIPFPRSYRGVDDLFPIPDGCFADMGTDGTPSNPALWRHGAHYELLGPGCVDDRTMEDMMRICMTICIHVNYGLAAGVAGWNWDDVDNRCIGVNYDEHGEVGKGHCHLQSSHKVTSWEDSTCEQSQSLNKGGLCAHHPGRPPRAQCGDGMILDGTSDCGTSNTMGVFCHFLNDRGPSLGRVCDLGSNWNADESICTVCEEGTYSSPVQDPYAMAFSLPRPRDSPSFMNKCMECVPGRFCLRASACPPGYDPETCPDRCPVGFMCPAGSPRPVRCKNIEYQDEDGQAECKMCPTAYGLVDGSDSLGKCTCPTDFYRQDIASVTDPTITSPCVACKEGMDCDWIGTIYIDPKSQLTRTDQINENSDFQTTPFLKRGYWSTQTDMTEVLLCDKKRTHPNCAGGDPRDRDGLCSDDRSGYLCSKCESNQQVLQDGGCSDCKPGADAALFVGMLCICMLILYALHRVSNRPEVQERLSSLTSVAAIGIILEMVQVVNAFAKVQVDWGQPFQGFLEILQTIAFEGFEAINLSCVVGTGAVTSLVMRLMVPVILVGLYAFIFAVDKLVRPDGSQSLAAFSNVVGLIFLTLYTSLATSTFSSLLCFDQPDGSKSQLDNPGIICYEDSDHWRLVAISIVFILLYPVGIICLCAYVVSTYHHKLVYDPLFSRRFKFMFTRWTTKRYYFPLIRLARNFLIAALPTLIPYENPEVILATLALVILANLVLQLTLQPWRSRALNCLDGMCSLVLVMLIVVISSALGTGMTTAQSTFSVVLITLLGFAAVLVSVWNACNNHFNIITYDYFLSHHKGAAGNTSRLIKLLLTKSLNQTEQTLKVFFDADDLSDLDHLFDAVRSSNFFVVMLSGELTQRAWCVGEIVVAFQNHVPIIPIVLPGCQNFSSDSTLDPTLLDESLLKQLAPYGINSDDVVDAFTHLASVPKHHAATAVEAAHAIKAQVKLMKKHHLLKQAYTYLTRTGESLLTEISEAANHKSTKMTNVIMTHTRLSSTGQNARFLVVGGSNDLEAQSLAIYTKMSIGLLQHGIVVISGIEDKPIDSQDCEVYENLVGAAIILTKGALSSPLFLAHLAILSRIKGLILQPASAKDFAFPEHTLTTAMRTSGHPVAKSVEHFEMQVNACFDPGDSTGGIFGHAITAAECADAVQELFKKISVPYDINYTGEAGIREQTDALITRLEPRKKLKHSGSAKLGSSQKMVLPPTVRAAKADLETSVV